MGVVPATATAVLYITPVSAAVAAETHNWAYNSDYFRPLNVFFWLGSVKVNSLPKPWRSAGEQLQALKTLALDEDRYFYWGIEPWKYHIQISGHTPPMVS